MPLERPGAGKLATTKSRESLAACRVFAESPRPDSNRRTLPYHRGRGVPWSRGRSCEVPANLNGLQTGHEPMVPGWVLLPDPVADPLRRPPSGAVVVRAAAGPARRRVQRRAPGPET